MGENSKIEWTDDSVNLWWGCVEVGPGCTNCYARDFSKRLGKSVWGIDAPREEKKTPFGHLAKFQKMAVAGGRRRRVFVNSMSDLAEILPPEHPSSGMMNDLRGQFFKGIADGLWPDLDLIWLTKRIGNVRKLVPASWMADGWPDQLWILPTIVTRLEADRDIPKLMEIPAKVRGLSMEPLLEEVFLPECANGLNWIIVGGESGPKARPFDPQNAYSLLKQSRDIGAAFFFKQMGAKPFDAFNDCAVKTLDAKGHDWVSYPELRVREFPV